MPTRTRSFFAALSMLMLSVVPVSAQADWGRHRDGPNQIDRLRWACHQGERRACVRLGREIEQRREARREWREERRDRWDRQARRGHHRGW